MIQSTPEFPLAPTLAAGNTPAEVDYSRLAATPFARQQVEHLRVVAVGAGALGNEVVKALGLTGVGRVLVVDPDTVEPSNLTRSVWFRDPASAGRNKAKALAAAAAPCFPDTQLQPFEGEIADAGFSRLAGTDVLISCVDSDAARLDIAYISTQLGVPVCDGGLGGEGASRGRVTWFDGQAGACYGCLLREERRRELLTTWGSAAHSCWQETDGSPVRASTPTLAAIVGSLQVEIALRHLMDRTKHKGEAVSVELAFAPGEAVPKMETIRIAVNPGCPFHGTDHGRQHRVRGEGRTFAELLDGVEAAREDFRPVIVLDWPLCLQARCEACGGEWRPLQRLGYWRRHGHCPRCGSRALTVTETLRHVNRESEWAVKHPEELGLPGDHLFLVGYEAPAA